MTRLSILSIHEGRWMVIAVFGLVVWFVFCVRDVWLLEAFAGGRKRLAISCYSASAIAAAALVMLLFAFFRPSPVVILSRPLLIAALAAHALVSAWSVWVARREHFSGAWKLALVPPPAGWILLLLAATAISSHRPAKAVRIAAAIAAGSAIVVAAAASRFTAGPACRDDCAFPVRFAAFSNCLACCLLPLVVS